MIPGAPKALARAVEALCALPGIGPKTATRLALAILERGEAPARALADAIAGLVEGVRFCARCGGFAEDEICAICANPRRDAAVVCVVEQPVDVLVMERAQAFSGVYHVLHGRLDPLGGVDAEALRLRGLDARVADGVRELVLATSATVDGEATAHFLARRYAPSGVRISRLARGVPEGGELEYLDEFTLRRALSERVAWSGDEALSS